MNDIKKSLFNSLENITLYDQLLIMGLFFGSLLIKWLMSLGVTFVAFDLLDWDWSIGTATAIWLLIELIAGIINANMKIDF